MDMLHFCNDQSDHEIFARVYQILAKQNHRIVVSTRWRASALCKLRTWPLGSNIWKQLNWSWRLRHMASQTIWLISYRLYSLRWYEDYIHKFCNVPGNTNIHRCCYKPRNSRYLLKCSWIHVTYLSCVHLC